MLRSHFAIRPFWGKPYFSFAPFSKHRCFYLQHTFSHLYTTVHVGSDFQRSRGRFRCMQGLFVVFRARSLFLS